MRVALLWCCRDMLCCQNEGILTPFQGAQIEILCTHPVTFAITCLATSGPTNISSRQRLQQQLWVCPARSCNRQSHGVP